MVNVIHDYVHEYDFTYDHILNEFKEEIINNYFFWKDNQKELRDIGINQNREEFKFIKSQLIKLITDNYFTGPLLGDNGLRVYVQDNKINTSILHDHCNIVGTICAIFYLNIPKGGGEIMFKYLDDSEWGKEIIIKPKLNKVYLFPYWLPHKPLPQKDQTPRISINWMHGSNVRAIHKNYLKPW